MINKEKIQHETERLEIFNQLSIEAIENYANLYPNTLPEMEMEKLSQLLGRMFIAEIDYLQQNPEDYFDLYEDE